MDKEFSAGGVVSRGGKLLLVRVTNLKGETVWTFPKGHPEKGETPLETALREVEEETGWRCRKAGSLLTARYRFARQGRRVSKKVKWYWFKPVEKTGKPDADEVHATRWVAAPSAGRFLRYPSDLELLEKWRRKSGEEAKR